MATVRPNGFAQPLIPTAPSFRPARSTPPLRAVVEVRVKDRSGLWPTLDFVVDSGAGVTSIPWITASIHDIPIGTLRTRTNLSTAGGSVEVDCRRHTIEIEFPLIPGRTFVVDCEFRDVPDTVPAILGIGGNVLRQLDIHFDGRPSLPDAPYGFVVIDVQTPLSALVGTPPLPPSPSP